MITIAIQAASRLSETSAIRAAAISSLSAIGSISFPNVVTASLCLAMYPSSVSVSAASAKTPAAIASPLGVSSSRATTTTGTSRMRRTVSAFGRLSWNTSCQYPCPVDWTVYPNTPISRLPRPLRYPALLLRNIVFLFRRPPAPAPSPPPSDYVYQGDGLATVGYSPFQHDPEWSAAYEEMASEWYPERPGLDIRWRMWILTSVARQTRQLPGNVAEFGVYRAGCARMILGTVGTAPDARYHLFDTFAGIPDSELTEGERAQGFVGRLSNTSVDYVRERLAPWRARLVFHVGDIFETIPRADTGDLSLVHMDLNASAPTRIALEYAYERLVPGGIIVFDDYGHGEENDQRTVIDEVCGPLPENLIVLPSRQALLVRLP